FEALAETIVPGAAEAGVAHYVDAQFVAKSPKFILRSLDFPAPPGDFYRGSIAALNGLSQTRHAGRFEELTAEQRAGLLVELMQGNPVGWEGPPAGFFYFIARNDAIDAYYGTPEGFARLEIPYMAHITPPEGW
ncbi:MAG: gluconate 2-dehydrogenase subunit 3 family protein, partial [Thermomicrobiales bacterium]